MTAIDMKGLDWGSGPTQGIYLMGHDTSAEQVARGGGGMLRSQKIKGWDGGKFIPGDVKTSAEALALTGLDWDVDQRPIIKVEPTWGANEKGEIGIIGWEPQLSDEKIDRGKGKQVNSLPTGGYSIVPGHVQNVRRDTGQTLGVVGPGWHSPQNREMFTFMDDLVDSGDAKWLGGGMLDGGKRVWLACQFDRSVLIGGDENELSVPLGFFSNGWDGTLSFSVTAAPYRLACLNGQTIPLEGHVRTWKGRHTSGLTAEKRLAEARRTLSLSIGYFDSWAEEMEKLMSQKMSIPAVERAIVKILPDPPEKVDGKVAKTALRNVQLKREKVKVIYMTAPDLQHLGHSKYRALNAITSFVDWETKTPIDKQVLRSAEPNALKDRAFAVLTEA